MTGAPSPLPARPAPLPPGPRGLLAGSPAGRRRDPGLAPQPRLLPTHQLDALGEGVVLPVLLGEALQDLALAFPTP